MIIVITLPYFIDREAEKIVAQFEQRHIDLLHLRKPQASEEEVERLIRAIPKEYYPRITLHDFHALAFKYQLGGIHLTGRHPEVPEGWEGRVSTSCHSVDELARRKQEGYYVNGNRRDFAYLSLSPIFDSISKQGYCAAFSEKVLNDAYHQGIIDQSVLALGGVTFDLIETVRRMGFGGAMILGDAWRKNDYLT